MKGFLKGAAIVIGILVVLVVGSSAFSSYIYATRCTKCLRSIGYEEHMVFKKVYRTELSVGDKGFDLTPITGSACEHVFRRDQFSISDGGILGKVGCGVSKDGGLFRPRWNALQAAFILYGKTDDNRLMKETFDIVDSLLPADASFETHAEGKTVSSIPELEKLSEALYEAKNSKDWEEALAKARKKDGPVTSN